MVGFPDLWIPESDLVCPITDRKRNHYQRQPKNSPPYQLFFPRASPLYLILPFLHSCTVAGAHNIYCRLLQNMIYLHEEPGAVKKSKQRQTHVFAMRIRQNIICRKKADNHKSDNQCWLSAKHFRQLRKSNYLSRRFLPCKSDKILHTPICVGLNNSNPAIPGSQF